MVETKGLRVDKNGNLQRDKRHKSFYYYDQPSNTGDNCDFCRQIDTAEKRIEEFRWGDYLFELCGDCKNKINDNKIKTIVIHEPLNRPIHLIRNKRVTKRHGRKT